MEYVFLWNLGMTWGTPIKSHKPQTKKKKAGNCKMAGNCKRAGENVEKVYLPGYLKKRGIEGRLSLSLWYHSSGSGQLQKASSRFSVLLDFYALYLMSINLEDIDRALAISDTANFLGFTLHLGKYWFVTIERDDSCVSIRRWWSLGKDKGNPTAELLPSRDGLKLNKQQFKKFKLFLQNQLHAVFPTFANHVFTCDKPSHVVEDCTICRPLGVLPMQTQIHRIMRPGE